MRLLKVCKEERHPVSIPFIRSYLAGPLAGANLFSEAREALRWFVVQARVQVSREKRPEARRNGSAIPLRREKEKEPGGAYSR